MIRSLLVAIFALTTLNVAAAAKPQTRLDFVARVFLTTPDEQFTSSGILIEDNLVLTNHHAIHGDGEISVELANGEIVPARVLKSTKVQDLALLEIAPVEMPTVTLGSLPRANQPVRIYGFARGTKYRESAGVMTGPARPAKTSRDTMFTTDAGVIQGMSGGPVLDENMELVGVLFGGDEEGSYCVSISTVREFLGQIRSPN